MSGWRIELSATGGTRLGIVHRGGAPLTRSQFFTTLSQDPLLRAAWTATLRGIPVPAYRWETPPLSPATVALPFMFVVLDAPALVRRPDIQPFAEPLARAPAGPIACLPNLGGDALLIVPQPRGEADYAHLAAFLRNAPDADVDALWQTVGQAVAERVAGRIAPLWISTAGLGVPWLHVRLDDRPKYYEHAPYRRS